MDVANLAGSRLEQRSLSERTPGPPFRRASEIAQTHEASEGKREKIIVVSILWH